MQAAIVVFPGTNREMDAAAALGRASGRQPALVWHRETGLPAGTDLVVLPGGFSYGDYLRCGAMAALSPVMGAVRRHAERGGAVLGICNGFQVLCEAGLLPGALLRNASLKFVCKDVHLRVEETQSIFTRRYRTGQVIRVPTAHGDGNYFADEATLDALEAEGLVAFRYVTADDRMVPEANVNGAARNISGILSANRRVLGMMPHPEDHTDPLQGCTDGLPMFQGLVEALA